MNPKSPMENLYYSRLSGQVKRGRNVFIAHNATVIGRVTL